MGWKKLLESTQESLNDQIRLRNAYLMAENRILRNQIDGRVQLTDSERKELAEIGAKLGRKVLAEVATVARPETILAWNRKLANESTDISKRPKSVGRPRVDKEIEDWVVRMACENHSWGYDRIQGSLKHLGYTISDQTVGNILKRHDIPPAPERKKTVTWREFVYIHLDVLMSTGFFNCEVWSWFGRIISVVLSFIHFSRHLLRCGSLVAPRLQQFGLKDTLSELTGSEVLFVEAPSLQSLDAAQVIALSSTRRPIRDGPHRYQHRLYGLQEPDYREAA